MEKKKAAVIGYPIEHSLSPLIHNMWLKEEKIIGEYEKILVKPNELKNYLLTIKEKKLNGINITIPHKEEAYKILKDKANISKLAKEIEAINTIYIKNGEIYADNTDYFGFKKSLIEKFPKIDLTTKKILIIGAGGAAKAIILGLLKDNIKEISLINRTKEKAEILRKHTKEKIYIDDLQQIEEKISAAEIIVNTTSCGLNNLNNLAINHSKIKGKKIFYDIVYKPLETQFLINAKANGHQIIEGINMLIYQAIPAFNYFFGKVPKITNKQKKIITKAAQSN